MDAAWRGMRAVWSWNGGAWNCADAENFSNGEPFRGMGAVLSCTGGVPSSALDPLGAGDQGGFASAPLTEANRGSSLVATFKKLQVGAWRCQDELARWGCRITLGSTGFVAAMTP
jgi:hypothetical protein